MDQMRLTYVTNGDPERIPVVGTLLPVKEHLVFKVEGYGDSREIDGAAYGFPGKQIYEIDLLGCLVIPAGSPMSMLEDILNGKI